MSEQFSVGDVVEGCNFIFDTDCNGMECEILEGLLERVTCHRRIGVFVGVSYVVRWSTGEISHVAPCNLRRRKPPTTGEESVLAMFKRTTTWEGAPA